MFSYLILKKKEEQFFKENCSKLLGGYYSESESESESTSSVSVESVFSTSVAGQPIASPAVKSKILIIYSPNFLE